MSPVRAYRHYLIRMGETRIALSNRRPRVRQSLDIFIFGSLATLVVAALVLLFAGMMRHSVVGWNQAPTSHHFAADTRAISG